MISEHLKECGFVKNRPNTKRPMDRGWPDKPYTYDQALQFIKEGFNVGILLAPPLIAIDSDHPTLGEEAKKILPLTFQQKSALRRLPHLIFKCPKWKTPVTFYDQKGAQIGQILCGRQQILVAPSKINGQNYEITHETEITEISSDKIIQLIQRFPTTFKQADTKQTNLQNMSAPYGGGLDNLTFSKVGGFGGFKRAPNGELWGANPWHGSNTGRNTALKSETKGFCFRCNAGFNPLKAFALSEGILRDCSETLRGSDFHEAYALAVKKGLLPQAQQTPSNIADPSDPLELRTFKDFEKIRVDTDYLVQDILPRGVLVMVYAPPASLKSIIILAMAMAITTAKSFLGFKTKKHAVVYSDKENSDQLIRDRLVKIRKAFRIKRKDFPLFFLVKHEGNLDDPTFIKRLIKTIEEKKIKLVIFDTLHRHSQYDENSANDLNKLYTKVFLPLIHERGVSVVFLHHTNKTGGYRGSGDFLGMCDIVLKISRDGKSTRFRITNEKNRLGEIDEITGKVHFEDDLIRLEKTDAKKEAHMQVDKLREFTSLVKSFFQDGALLKRSDIEFKLSQEGHEYNLSLLKRVLKFLIDNGTLMRDGKKGYRLAVHEEEVN